MGALSDRRSATQDRMDKLRLSLESAEERAAGKACVYVTGSFGRNEASDHSDLDLFIVGMSKVDDNNSQNRPHRLLDRLDEICIKADLINTTRTLGIPKFSGDGEYLVHYTVHELTKTLGKPDDDAANTFTARLLLLLESRPLLGTPVYK